MEEKKKSKKIVIISVISCVVVLAIVGIVCFVFLSNKEQLKLYNAKLELGKENYLEELIKEDNVYVKEGYKYSVKDSKIDINNVGIYDVTFEIKGEGNTIEEVKQISVVDTTPPTVELKQDTFYIGDNINIEEIVKIKDLSQEEELSYNEAKAKTEGQFDTSKEGESIIQISVTDKNGVTGTQELKINVKNPIVNLYDYITSALKNGKTFTDGSYDNKFVIKYNDSYNSGLSSSGWINFTEKVYYDYTKYSTSYLTTRSADLCYFDDNYQITKVYTSTGVAIDNITNGIPSGFKLQTGDLSNYQSILTGDIDRVHNLLKDKNKKINLLGKTVDQLKNETIDLRELQ